MGNNINLDNKFNILIINLFSNSTPRTKDPKTLVPQPFVTLLKMTLAKMVGNKVLDPALVPAEFWPSWARKFTSATAYEARKKRKIQETKNNQPEEVSSNKI